MTKLLRVALCFTALPAAPCFLAAQTSKCPSADIAAARAQAGAQWSLEAVRAQMIKPADDLVLATAHRGSWRYCPENTVEAFHQAMDDGAEAIEMDIRTAVDGTPFLTHDWDLRGEAPVTAVGRAGNNFIYALSPSDVLNKAMVNRVGGAATDSSGNPIRFRNLTALLDSYIARVALISGGISGSQVARGSMIVLDLKGSGNGAESYIENRGYVTDQYSNLLNSLRAVKAWQDSSGYQLFQNAIAFKLNYKAMPARATFQSDLATIGIGSTPPNLIFIVFPEDVLDSAGAVIAPPGPQKFADYVANYPSYLLTDFQYRYPGISVERYVLEARAEGRGVGGFASTNAFPEGNRDSDGTCGVKGGYLVRNGCAPQALQSFATSALDFIVPPSVNGVQTVKRASSITTDWYLNLLNYLAVVGLRNTSYIK